MVECWLRKNRRIEALILALVAVAILPGVGLLATGGATYWRTLGIVWTTLACLSLGTRLWCYRQPVVGRQGDQMLLYLCGIRPIRVPLEVVEVFFLGQLETEIRTAGKTPETSTVVVRLAEKAEAWKRLPVSSRLARWCDGYITIRGLWCEHLNLAVVNQMNHQLVTAKRQLRQRNAGDQASQRGSAPGSHPGSTVSNRCDAETNEATEIPR